MREERKGREEGTKRGSGRVEEWVNMVGGECQRSLRPSLHNLDASMIISIATHNKITPHTAIKVMARFIIEAHDGNLPQEIIDEVQRYNPPKGKRT